MTTRENVAIEDTTVKNLEILLEQKASIVSFRKTKNKSEYEVSL